MKTDQNKKIKHKTTFGCICMLLLCLLAQPAFSESNISPEDRHAWSENVGWLDFRPDSFGGVIIYDSYISGYAWAMNIGWVKLGSNPGGPYDNEISGQWGVNRDSGGEALSGFAWSELVGWIDFQPAGYDGVAIDTTTGSFDGYAWSQNAGWIHFKNDAPHYNVVYSPHNLSGTVRYRDGETPIPDTELQLFKVAYDIETLYAIALTDENGNYTFIGVTGGEYILRAARAEEELFQIDIQDYRRVAQLYWPATTVDPNNPEHIASDANGDNRINIVDLQAIGNHTQRVGEWEFRMEEDSALFEEREISLTNDIAEATTITGLDFTAILIGDAATVEIISQREAAAEPGEPFVHEILAWDRFHPAALVAINIEEDMPDWLEFSDNGNGQVALTGMPTEDDVGQYTISIEAAGANNISIESAVIVTVEPFADIDEDELPDYWEQRIVNFDPDDDITGVGDIDPDDDFDGDGSDNRTEYDGGTDQTDPNSKSALLSEGYRFISFNLQPDDPDMESVFASVLDDLEYVRDSGGNHLRRIGDDWTNNIGELINIDGYLVKLENDATLGMEGDSIDADTPIPLTAGHQFISYLPNTRIDAVAAFAGILDNLIFARDSFGNVLRRIGAEWINNIGELKPGEGYLLKMSADDELVYPLSGGRGASEIREDTAPVHFDDVSGNPADPVWTIFFSSAALNRTELSAGDEIAVFDGDTLVGSVRLSGPLNEDDPFGVYITAWTTLTHGEGYAAGSAYTFRCWDADQGIESDSAVITLEDSDGDAYTEETFPTADAQYSVAALAFTGEAAPETDSGAKSGGGCFIETAASGL